MIDIDYAKMLAFLILIPAFFILLILFLMLILKNSVKNRKEHARRYFFNVMTGLFGGLMAAIALELKGKDVFSIGGIIEFTGILVIMFTFFVIGFFATMINKKTGENNDGRNW